MNTPLNNTNLLQVKKISQLNQLLNQGLVELYQTCFAAFPYYEAFTETAVKNIFWHYLNIDAQIYIATNKAGQPFAFAVSYEVAKNKELFNILNGVYHNGRKIDANKAIYMADAGVAPTYRRKGIGKQLDNIRFEAAQKASIQAAIVRTNPDNYRKIASIVKGGGTIIPKLTQAIAQKRQNGQIRTNERVFYHFDLSKKQEDFEITNLEKVIIARPGGNDTALVFASIPRNKQKATNDAILQIYPGIEQVMFAEQLATTGDIYGQMAGGEFCGNATRSLGYVLLNQKDGKIDLNVSGASTPLSIEVADQSAKAAMPIYPDFDKIKELETGLTLVSMEGISHLIAEPNSQLAKEFEQLDGTAQQKDAFVLANLKKYNLITQPASGIMLLNNENNQLNLHPYVYVRDINTLYYESACGSGTTAIGLLLSKRQNQSIDKLPVVQPSGMIIEVSVVRSQQSFVQASINGKVAIVFEDKMPLYYENCGNNT